MPKDNPTPESSAIEQSPKPAWSELLKTTEGYILLLGIAAALAGLIAMGVVAYWSPQTSEIIGAMSITTMTFGTAVSMSIGYVAGYGHLLVIGVNMWVETVVVLLFYPVFVMSMRKLVEFPWLKRVIENTHAAAERHHETVRRYGIFGLFMFVWIPFWMTGPVVGSVIGYLLGFPAWLTLTVVIIGTFMTLLGWAYLLSSLYTHAAIFGPWASFIIIGMLMLVISVVYLLDKRVKKRKAKAKLKKN